MRLWPGCIAPNADVEAPRELPLGSRLKGRGVGGRRPGCVSGFFPLVGGGGQNQITLER